MEYSNRNYVVFSVTELDKIDFTQVLETSTKTVRKSVNGTKTFVKWDGEIPPDFVIELTNIDGLYTHAEILEILSTEEWTSSNMDMNTAGVQTVTNNGTVTQNALKPF
jgi:hypothetical protein